MFTCLKPPFDAQLEAFMAQMPISRSLQPDMIPMVRTYLAQTNTADLIITGRQIEHEEHMIHVSGGGKITLSVFRPTGRRAAATHGGATKPGPGIYYIHGGGFVVGNRFLGMSVVADWIEELDMTCVSVEYRLAPEHHIPLP
jgi:acetyl esterase/lipase